MRWFRVGFCLVSIGWLNNHVYGQYPQNYQTRNGAMLGGVTGAVIGGVVGHQRDDTLEGALIGGAVGAIAGGVLGNQRDHADRKRYGYYSYGQPVYVAQPTYIEQRTYVPVQSTPIQPRTVTRRPVSVSEIVSMTQSGVSDSVIVSHIQANGVASRPDVNEVIWMNQQGVSDYVITAMQQHGNPRASSASTVYRTYPTEVIVREEYPSSRFVPGPTYRPSSRPVYVERRGF